MGPGLGEAVVVWLVFAVDLLAVAAGRGWSRDAESGAGRPGAPGHRVRAFVRHPLAPAAIPLGLLAVDRIAEVPEGRGSGRRMTVAAGSAGLAVMAARSATRRIGVDALAAGLVVASLGGTAVALATRDRGGFARRQRGDAVRMGVGAGLVAISLPWLLADLGVYAGDVPLLRRVYLSRQRMPPGARGAAVHLGHHHGLDGALLAWTGLALSRQVPAVRSPLLRESLALTTSLLTVYGAARAAEDAWYEQVVKRGWARVRLPSLVVGGRPTREPGWAGVAAGTAILLAMTRASDNEPAEVRSDLGRAPTGVA